MSWLDWIYWSLAALLALAGIWALWRGLLADRARGRERCPKCWYDMSASPGESPTCPECGRVVRRRAQLHRTRRRYLVASAGVVLLLAASVSAWMPQVRRHGWYGATPKWLVIALLPDPAAWCDERVFGAGGNGVGYWNVELDARDTSDWEEDLLFRRVRAAYASRHELWDGKSKTHRTRVMVERVPMGQEAWKSLYRVAMKTSMEDMEVPRLFGLLYDLPPNTSRQRGRHWVVKTDERTLADIQAVRDAVSAPGGSCEAGEVWVLDASKVLEATASELPHIFFQHRLARALQHFAGEYDFQPRDPLVACWKDKVLIREGSRAGFGAEAARLLVALADRGSDHVIGNFAAWDLSEAISAILPNHAEMREIDLRSEIEQRLSVLESNGEDLVPAFYYNGWYLHRGSPDSIARIDYEVRRLRRDIEAGVPISSPE